MEFEIKHGPSFASLFLTMDKGDKVRTESGSMVAMSSSMKIKTKATGGLIRSIFRKMLGGESVFMNTYKSTEQGGELVLSPTTPGHVVHKKLQSEVLMLQGTAFLASDPDIKIKTKFGGLKSMFAGEGAFWIRAKGTGDLWFNAYGNITEIDVTDKYKVDTGHIVAYEPSLKMKIRKVGGWKSTLLSGEGLVAEFSGTGKVYIQSRTLSSLVGWVTPMLPR